MCVPFVDRRNVCIVRAVYGVHVLIATSLPATRPTYAHRSHARYVTYTHACVPFHRESAYHVGTCGGVSAHRTFMIDLAVKATVNDHTSNVWSISSRFAYVSNRSHSIALDIACVHVLLPHYCDMPGLSCPPLRPHDNAKHARRVCIRLLMNRGPASRVALAFRPLRRI